MMAEQGQMRFTLARLLLQQAKDLQAKVREDLRTQHWGSDDIQMEQYNNMIGTAAGVFPDDPVLTNLIQMPDKNLQLYGHPIGEFIGLTPASMPADRPSSRLDARLDTLIDRLRLIVGDGEGDAEQTRPAASVLNEERRAEDQRVVDEVTALRGTAVGLPPIDVREFVFVQDAVLREVLKKDYLEAQRSFSSGAYKAAAILAGALIEGMLLDRLQQPSATSLEEYGDAVTNFPKSDGEINWDRVGLSQLIQAAGNLRVVEAGVLSMAEGARDYRDTSHPRAEVRTGRRAQLEEAELLLALVKLIYRDLSADHSHLLDPP